MAGIGYADAIAERKSRSEQATSILAIQKAVDVKGGEKMTILNKAECDKINEVIDYILAHQNAKVKDVKTRFNLTDAEYDMISDLMMPAQRQWSLQMHYRVRIGQILANLKREKEAIENATRKAPASA